MTIKNKGKDVPKFIISFKNNDNKLRIQVQNRLFSLGYIWGGTKTQTPSEVGENFLTVYEYNEDGVDHKEIWNAGSIKRHDLQTVTVYDSDDFLADFTSEELAPLSKKDNVNEPQHYTQGKIQPIDYIIANDIGFLAGNVVKYITRYKYKNGQEDLKKAQFYLNKLIATEYPE